MTCAVEITCKIDFARRGRERERERQKRDTHKSSNVTKACVMYNLLTSCNIVISGREVGPGLRKWNEGRPDEERQMQQRNYSHVKVADKKKEKYIRREIRV